MMDRLVLAAEGDPLLPSRLHRGQLSLMRRRVLFGLVLGAAFAASAGFFGLAFDRDGWHANRPSLQQYPVRGVDVSHHQGAVDWAKVATYPGVAFAYLKATEGCDWTDPRFLENWRQARASGLKVGAYHFFTFCRPAAEQATHFLSAVPREVDALPPVIDVEFAGNCRAVPSTDEVRRELHVLLAHIERELGKRPLVYATREAAEVFLDGGDFRYGLWFRSVLTSPYRDDWLLWQYDAHAEVPGIAGPVDLNVFRGARAELEKL